MTLPWGWHVGSRDDFLGGAGWAGADLRHLPENGYAVVPKVLQEEVIEPLRLWLLGLADAERVRSGAWTSKRKLHVEDLLDVGPALDQVVLSRALLEGAKTILGEDVYVHGMRLRAPLPGHGEQALHTDDDPEVPVRLMTALVPLVDVDVGNGAPRVLPGSHLRRPTTVPQDEMAEVAGQVIPPCPAGCALVFPGSLWHSGTRNLSTTPRPMLALTYARRGAGLPNDRRPAPATIARLGAGALIYSPA